MIAIVAVGSASALDKIIGSFDDRDVLEKTQSLIVLSKDDQ
ncbi:hypothetical protein [Rhizobium mesoamericanum]|nr:hypothetical protein [Rhizobium mesoamericanum]